VTRQAHGRLKAAGDGIETERDGIQPGSGRGTEELTMGKYHRISCMHAPIAPFNTMQLANSSTMSRCKLPRTGHLCV
jgi:hypothetical protein